MSISENLKSVRERVRDAVKRSPHGTREVTLMGVSKAQSVNDIRNAADLGLVDMGENYAQELMSKAALCLDKGIRWHFIGRLQSNKIKHILPYVSSIDSVDSIELAKKIARVKTQLELPKEKVPIMLQVNQGSERQKSGLPPTVVEELFQEFVREEGVEVVGLMSIPPAHKDVEKTRPYFRSLKELFESLKPQHPRPENFLYLSMGMSRDFEVAIEEGSNCVRVGEAIFGPRPKS